MTPPARSAGADRAERSLVAGLLQTTFAVLVTVLAIVGLATGALLHAQSRRDVDSELLAVGRAWGSGDIEPGEWATEHAESEVQLRMLASGDPLLPPDWETNAEQLEQPEWRDEGDRRVLLLPVERGPENDEEHAMIVASTPRITLFGSTGRFALAYTVVAAFAALVAGLLQEHLLREAVAPLLAASASVSRVMGAKVGARVDEHGPLEVAELLRAINALLDRLDLAFSAQSRFTAEAAHELRSPVTVMLGELDVALRRPRPAAEYEAVLRSTREEVARLAALVEGLLLLARVDTGQSEQGRVRIEVAAAMQEAAKQGDIERAGGTLVVDTARVNDAQGRPAVVEAHPALLAVALANLLRNAAVHAPGAAVTFRAIVRDGQVRFEVEDHGPGVPEGEREGAFDRLTRGRKGQVAVGQLALGPAAAGLGLGLPLAREIARRHGGDCLLLDPTPGGPTVGCRVALWLPLAQPDTRSPAAG